MLAATVFWSVNIVAVKVALRAFTPWALVQLRVTGAALVFALLFVAGRRRGAVKLLRTRPGAIPVLALCGVALNQLFFVAGVARTSVAHTALIVAMGPIFVLLLAWLLRLERLTLAMVVGMVVSFGGVAVLGRATPGQRGGATWAGDLLVLAGSVVFAYYTIEVKKVAACIEAIPLNALAFALGATLILPLGWGPLARVPWSGLTGEVMWAACYVVILGSVVPYTLFVFAMTDLTASRVAAFNYLQPAIATALAIALLSEKLSWGVLVGGALILFGVYLTERERTESIP